MARRGDVLCIVQAGGQGSRMDVLTRERAKPALPFGGVHRLIDFTLSSLAHSDLADVWVSVQYQVASIDDYLSGGRPWSLDRNRGGFRRMVPQTGTGPASEEGFAHGNADLLLRMRSDLETNDSPHVLVTSADHVFSMDLAPVVDEHIASGRTATVLTSEVTKRAASDNVVVLTGRGGVVTGVEVKPSRPSSGTVSTEIFLYRTDRLIEALDQLRAELAGEAEGADSGDSGLGDFGEHLLPRLIEHGDVRAVPLTGYWRDVGQPGQYLEAHRDLLADKIDVFHHADRPVISHWPDRPAVRVRAGAVVDGLLSPGCDVSGEVVRSVLGPGVVVEAGARVEDCVLFDDVRVERGADVRHSIVDERSVVGRGAVVGRTPTNRVAREEDIVLVGMGSRVGARTRVEAGARLEPGTSA